MDEYMGIIKLFAGNFAPRGWLFCDGSLLPVSQYTALFSLLGTTYGGNGTTNFALPDLRSRVPVGACNSNPQGLPVTTMGQVGGEATHTLLLQEIPAHNHAQLVSNADATQLAATAGSTIGTPTTPSGRGATQTNGFNTVSPNTALNVQSIGASGGSQPHNNMQPYVGIYYIICVEGVYPPRP